jgi:hypothetical protein
MVVDGTLSSDYRSSRDVHGLALHSHSYRRPFPSPAAAHFPAQTPVNVGGEYSANAR